MSGPGNPRPEGRRGCQCVDWSEHHHLAGALGAALLVRLHDLDWVRRADGSRAVHLTDGGRTGLADTFGVRLLDTGDDRAGGQPS